MPTQSVFALVDAMAERVRQSGTASADGLFRAQAAVVRSLADELRHHHPSSRWIASLYAQLAEEVERLEALIVAEPPAMRNAL